MRLFFIILFSISLNVFADDIKIFQECRNGKCGDVIWRAVEDYRIYTDARHLKPGACYKVEKKGFIYIYKVVKIVDDNFVDFIYERVSINRSTKFEFILYQERIGFIGSDLENGQSVEFPCSYAPKLWDQKYVQKCLIKNKRKNFCNQPFRAPRDFRSKTRK